MVSMISAPNLAPNLPSPTIKPGAEKVFKLNRILQFGGSYIPTFLSYSSGAFGALRLFNIVTHIRIPGLGGLRFDTAVGVSQRTVMQIDDPNHLTKSSGLAPEGGMGFSFPILIKKTLAIGPHLGLRMIRNGPSSLMDLGPHGLMYEMGADVSVKL
jgi:hypothetical protein